MSRANSFLQGLSTAPAARARLSGPWRGGYRAHQPQSRRSQAWADAEEAPMLRRRIAVNTTWTEILTTLLTESSIAFLLLPAG